jgi:hypothetical protein
MALNIAVTDQGKETGGVDFPFPFVEGVSFLIARANNINHKKKLAELRVPFTLSGKKMSAADEEQILIKSLPGVVILGWKGVADSESGKQVEYSDERCLEILRDPSCRDIFEWVLGMATSMDNYRNEEIKTKGKS